MKEEIMELTKSFSELMIPHIDFSSAIYTPKRHTVESYRSQQRRAKKKRRTNGRKK